MRIDEADVEWAVVERLRHQLETVQATEFEHSMSLALVATILGWCSQRLHTPDQYQGVVPASFFEQKAALTKKPFAEAFGIDIGTFSDATYSHPEWVSSYQVEGGVAVGLPENESALCTLRALRNGFCHSDARTVLPWNVDVGEPRRLKGFYVLLTWWNGNQAWKLQKLSRVATLCVSSRDLCLIGTSVATTFCQIMSSYIFQTATGNSEDVTKQVLTEEAA